MRLASFLVGLSIGLVIFTIIYVVATSRPAPVIPAVRVETAGREPDQGRTEVPRGSGASPSPTVILPPPSATPRPTPRPKIRAGSGIVLGPVVSGIASWYADRRKSGLYAAAGPPLRTGHWRGRTVTVSAGGRSFRVILSDWCACRNRVIDLSPTAFGRLAPLSRGVVTVTVR